MPLLPLFGLSIWMSMGRRICPSSALILLRCLPLCYDSFPWSRCFSFLWCISGCSSPSFSSYFLAGVWSYFYRWGKGFQFPSRPFPHLLYCFSSGSIGYLEVSSCRFRFFATPTRGVSSFLSPLNSRPVPSCKHRSFIWDSSSGSVLRSSSLRDSLSADSQHLGKFHRLLPPSPDLSPTWWLLGRRRDFCLIFFMAIFLQWNCRGYSDIYEELARLVDWYCPTVLCLKKLIHNDNPISGPSDFHSPLLSNHRGESDRRSAAILPRRSVPFKQLSLNTHLYAVVVLAYFLSPLTICFLYLAPSCE